jgi:alkaline phosphatase D
VVLNIDRRSLVLGAGLGLGALVLSAGRGLAAEVLGATGFTHNVASGEPGPDSMLLWTRYVPSASDNTVRLEVELALDPASPRWSRAASCAPAPIATGPPRSRSTG